MNTMKIDTYQNIIQIEDKLNIFIENQDVNACKTLVDSLERNLKLLKYDSVLGLVELKLINQLLIKKYNLFKSQLKQSLDNLDIKAHHDYTIIYEKLQRMMTTVQRDINYENKSQGSRDKFKLYVNEKSIVLVSTNRVNAYSSLLHFFGNLNDIQITSNCKLKHPNKTFNGYNIDFFRGVRGDVLYIDSTLGLKFYVDNLKSLKHFNRVELIEESDYRN